MRNSLDIVPRELRDFFAIAEKIKGEEINPLSVVHEYFVSIREKGINKRTRKGEYRILEQNALLHVCELTTDDVAQAPSHLQEQLTKAYASYVESRKEESRTKQLSISLTDTERYVTQKMADASNMKFGDYIREVLLMLAWHTLNRGKIPSEYATEDDPLRAAFISLQDVNKEFVIGRCTQDAFTPDEVKLAMDKADISASQAVTLMQELERLRDERLLKLQDFF